jgi:hypothetical protein
MMRGIAKEGFQPRLSIHLAPLAGGGTARALGRFVCGAGVELSMPAKSKEPRSGDHVEWESSGGHSTGTVVKKLTAPMKIKGHKVAASPRDPEFLVKSEKGGVAAHKAQALKPSKRKPSK